MLLCFLFLFKLYYFIMHCLHVPSLQLPHVSFGSLSFLHDFRNIFNLSLLQNKLVCPNVLSYVLGVPHAYEEAAVRRIGVEDVALGDVRDITVGAPAAAAFGRMNVKGYGKEATKFILK